MLRWIARKGLGRFGKRYDYNIDYMEQMLTDDPAALYKLALLMPASQHRNVTPKNAYFATKLLAALSEDCGPCAQLCVNMALEAGMAPEQVEAVLSGDTATMHHDTTLGYQFAQATLQKSSEQDATRDAVEQAWGRAAVAELSLCLAVSRVYPQLKSGLGFAKTCQRLTVGSRPVQVRHACAA